jgi:hypothetical protein
MMDAPVSDHELQTAVNELTRVLLSHECIEQVSCG